MTDSFLIMASAFIIKDFTQKEQPYFLTFSASFVSFMRETKNYISADKMPREIHRARKGHSKCTEHQRQDMTL